MRDAAAETPPWEAQAGADDAAYRAQIAALFERSPFYRGKLAAAGFRDTAAVGGLDAIAALPFTEKDELRASRSVAHPIGAQLAAPMADVVRIYSTSGTTGSPSYIPLTAEDLAAWIEISSRSYAAWVSAPGSGSCRPMARDRSWRRWRSMPLRRSACSYPGRARQPERLLAAVASGARRDRADPVLRAAPRGMAEAHGIDLAGSIVARCWLRASRAAASRLCERGWRGPGGRGSPRRWASATSPFHFSASARPRRA